MAKIYRNKKIKDEGFPDALSMDDIEDGTTYGKVKSKFIDDKGNIKAKTILLSEVIGTLDDIEDGVYGKVLKTSITAGKIVLSEVTGTSDDLSEGSVNKWDTGVPPADLDALVDGAVYGRYLKSALDSGKALLSQAVGDLDDIVDGTYGKVLVTDISAGHILLAAATGDLDDIADGTISGKIKITDIQSGHILLATAVGDSDDILEGAGNFFAGASGADFVKTIDTLDNILDGASWGKVAFTDIQSGHILLGTAVGTLDDIDNGTEFGRVNLTSISAGKISLVTGISGSLPVANSDAKCTDPDADQTSVNTAAYINGQGGLATQNNLDGVPDGATWQKIYATDIDAGHISLIEKTVSGTYKQISLDASVPHMKVAYNGSDVVQMAVTGTEPRLEVYYGGYIRTRLNKNSLNFFGVTGSSICNFYAKSSAGPGMYIDTPSNPLYVIAPQLNLDGDTLNLNFGTAYNGLKGDGTHLEFNGDSNCHLVPAIALIGSAQIGTATNYWGSIYAQTLRYKTAPSSFDKYDDLQILRDLKTSGNKIDMKSMPKEVYDKNGFINLGDLEGFSLCASKKIVETIDDLNNRLKE